jgi:predicted RNA methylase
MMQDYIRTATYQRAIICNQRDFQDKVVLDVGAGSGILSFFALQAGARKVYAVEASSMAMHAEVRRTIYVQHSQVRRQEQIWKRIRLKNKHLLLFYLNHDSLI